MFTIRQVQRDGSEQVFEGKTVRLDYDPHTTYPSRRLTVTYDTKSESNKEAMFCTGVLFVMNDNGKTVAKYDFDTDINCGQGVVEAATPVPQHAHLR